MNFDGTFLVSFISAVGLGSVLSTIVQHCLSRKSSSKEKLYNERKEAYVGLLDAWRNQDVVGNTPETSSDVGYWSLRVSLVASNEVNSMLVGWNETEPGSAKRIEITSRLKNAMRNDLVKP